MTEEKGKTGEGRTLHLEVVDAQTVILECFNLLIKFRVGKWGTEFAALRSVETATGYGDSTNHIIAGYLVEQFRIVVYTVWVANLVVPFYLALEFCLCFEVADFVAAGIEVDESVETDALLRGYEGSGRAVELQAAAGSDAHEGERGVLGFLGAGFEIDVLQRIELVDYDIDIIASYSGALHGDSLAFICAGDGVEFPT